MAGNFTSNGHLDLAVAEPFIDAVTVLLGNGDGTFTQGSTISFGEPFPFAPSSMSLVAGDFRNNGHTDLAVASSNVFPLTEIPSTCFWATATGPSRPPPVRVDLPRLLACLPSRSSRATSRATASSTWPPPMPTASGTDDYSVYLGNGDGTFQPATPFALGGSGGSSTAIVTGDFAGNGRTDLAITRTSPDNVQVRLSNGDGTFSSPSVVDLVRPETPLVADLNGDGAPDVSVVDAAGDILYPRRPAGRARQLRAPGDGQPGRPVARHRLRLDQISVRHSPASTPTTTAISFFALRSTGFVKVASLATGSEPAQILTADLDGNGVTDLIVRNAGDGTISVFPGDGNGWFLPPRELSVGVGASDIEVADLEQNGRLDIVYTDRLSGEVGVLENLGGGLFAPRVLYRAGPGPYGVTGTADPSPVSSLEGTTSVAVGTFTREWSALAGRAQPGLEHLRRALGPGRWPPLQPELTSRRRPPARWSARSTLAATARPDWPSSPPTDSSSTAVTAREASCRRPRSMSGFEPNGLTVADLNGDGKADLLVSNPLGDVQVLIGNGDGTFQPVRNLDQQVSLAVYAPNGTAPAAFVFANQLTDQLVVQTVGGGTTVLEDAATGLITPGAVTLADLNNNGILDLIVANSGSNNVLVYPGLGNGTFGTRRSTAVTASSRAPIRSESPSPTSTATAGST